MHACDEEHLLPEEETEREIWQKEIDARNSTIAQQTLSPLPSLSSESLQILKQIDTTNIRKSVHWWMRCKNTFTHVANKVGVITHKVQNTFAKLEKENYSALNINRECENVSSPSLLSDMCKGCTNKSSDRSSHNENEYCEQQIENLVGHDNQHALFDLIPINNDSNSYNIIGHVDVNTDIDNDDDFNDSQMNDAFAYSSSSQSHYSNSTSSFHSNAAHSKRDNATECRTSKTNTNMHTSTNVPSTLSSNPSASKNCLHFLTEKPLNLDEHKHNSMKARSSSNNKQDVENNSVKNTRMYKKLNEVWQKCKKATAHLVKKRPWIIKQNSRQGKRYLPFSSCCSDYNINKKSQMNCNFMTVKVDSEKQQERHELSNWEYSAWNMPIVPDAVIYQLRSMVTLQIGQNADNTLYKSLEQLQEAFELSTSTTTFHQPIQTAKELPTESYTFKESNDVHHTNSVKNVHVNSTRDKLNIPTCTTLTEQVAYKTHKRVRRENDNANNLELRLAKELLQLTNILQNSKMQSCSQQQGREVKKENEEFSERCNANGFNTEEELQEQSNEKNVSKNNNADDIENNVMECTWANQEFIISSKPIHIQHYTFSNYNTSRSIKHTKNKELEAFEHNLTHHSTSPSGLDTMHNNELFNEMYICNRNSDNNILTASKEKNEEHSLPYTHKIEQQFANEVYKHNKEECNEHTKENVQSLCVYENLDKQGKNYEESSDIKSNISCQLSVCPLLNLVSNDHDVAVRNVYDTLLTEFLQRAVQERVNCKLANLNNATERGLSESILRQVLTHFMSNNSDSKNRKQAIEKETRTNAKSLQEQNETNSAECFSTGQTNLSELVKTNTNYNIDEIDSMHFTGVVQHIRAGKPVMLQMLEFNEEDEEILNRVASLRHNNHDNAVSLSTPGYSMTYAQLGTLCASCWLSDQVINNYLQLLCESFRVSSAVGQANLTGASTIDSLGTHFYAKVQTELSSLSGGNYDYTYDATTQTFCWNFPPLPEKSAILRWLRRRLELLRPYKPQRKVDINNNESQDSSKYKFNEQNNIATIKWEQSKPNIQSVPLESNESVTCVRVVFIPVNIHDQHWALVVWNKETEQLIYYDSLGRRSGYYRRSCLGSGDNFSQKYFMQNTGKVTPTQAERILAELDHVLSECQRHLLCANKTEKSSVFTDSFSQGSYNTFDSVNNRQCRDFVSVVGGSEQVDIMPKNKMVNATHNKLRVEHVIADSYTASLHDLSDYKPFRNLFDLQVAQEEFNSKTRKNDICNKNKSGDYNDDNNNRNYNYETSLTMSGEECTNDMSDMEIEWFAKGHLKVPRQSNGNDCGVFVCQVAWCVAHGVAVNFTQQDIHILRNVMILELWCKRILRRLPSMITSSSCDVNLNTL